MFWSNCQSQSPPANPTSNERTPLAPTTISLYVFPKKQKSNGRGTISLNVSSWPTKIAVP